MAGVTASDIPGVSQALDYLAAKARAFRATGPQLLKMMHVAAVAVASAKQAGDAAREAEARAALQRITALYQDWSSWDDRLAVVWEWLASHGLGAVPLLVAGAAVAAIAAVSYILAQTAIESRKLSLLASGAVTPEELKEIGGGSLVNVDLGSLVPWALAIGGLWWFLGQQQKGKRIGLDF